MEEKIEIQMENQLGCPVCGMGRYEDGKPLYKVKRTVDLYYARCENCGNYWLIKRMTDEYTKEYYRDHYRAITLPTEEKKVRNLQIEDLRSRVQLAAMKSVEPVDGMMVLEYGSSSGTMLKKLRDEHSCNVLGIEVSPLESDYPTVERLEDVDDLYDWLILSHVLEHQNFPTKFLYMMLTKLKPNGKIMIDVPNANADPTAFLLHHPIAFSAQGVRHMLDLMNIEILAYYPYDWDMSPMHRSQIFVAKL